MNGYLASVFHKYLRGATEISKSRCRHCSVIFVNVRRQTVNVMLKNNAFKVQDLYIPPLR